LLREQPVAALTEDGEESMVAAAIQLVSVCSRVRGWTNGKEDVQEVLWSALVAGILHRGRITMALDSYSIEAERERKRERGSARRVVENEEAGWEPSSAHTGWAADAWSGRGGGPGGQ
jgi:hypothetical protein